MKTQVLIYKLNDIRNIGNKNVLNSKYKINLPEFDLFPSLLLIRLDLAELDIVFFETVFQDVGFVMMNTLIVVFVSFCLCR